MDLEVFPRGLSPRLALTDLPVRRGDSDLPVRFPEDPLVARGRVAPLNCLDNRSYKSFQESGIEETESLGEVGTVLR